MEAHQLVDCQSIWHRTQFSMTRIFTATAAAPTGDSFVDILPSHTTQLHFSWGTQPKTREDALRC